MLASSLFAKSCPDDMAIDQLPLNKTFITINQTKNFDKPNKTFEVYAAGKNTYIKERLFDDAGAYFKSLIWSWIKHPGRSFGVTYHAYLAANEYSHATFMLTHKKTKLVPGDSVDVRLDGISIDFSQIHYIFESEFTFTKINPSVDYPITMVISPNRPLLDPRQKKYPSLKSLKYNLGKQFTVHTECD